MFQIDLKNRKAVYAQIVDNFKRLVDTGILPQGTDIPNVKDMSTSLTVNPNTVTKAYLELENQGYFFTEEGQDWSVADSSKGSTEDGEDAHGEVTALYGKLHANMQELIARGESREAIGSLIGMGLQSYLQVQDLSKHFDEIAALDGLNLNINKGSIYGLVGVNGSGKTTILRLLAGVYQPDSGIVKVDGMPAYGNSHGKVVGYIPEDSYYLPGYTMEMLSKFFRNKYKQTWNNERYKQLMELFKLSETQVVSTFSKGLQKQAGFILAISTMPDVLLLDETIDGLDPIIRRQALRYIIDDVGRRDMTVLITSHNMRELDGICDTIGIIKKGRMLIERDLDDLRTNVHKVQVAFTQDFLTNNFPYDALDVLHMEELGSTDLLVVRGKEEEISAHIRGFAPLVYDHLPMTLEEIFIYETEGDTND